MAEFRTVNMRRFIFLLAGAGALLFALFDVRFVFEVSTGERREIADPAVEAEYARCYASRDEEIHTRAFGTIDNPDVQREFITSERAVARRECRAQYPASMITIEDPARFNLVDLEPRFW